MAEQHVVTVWRDESPPGLEDAIAIHAECRSSVTTATVMGWSRLPEHAAPLFDVQDPAIRSMMVLDHEARCDLGTATAVLVGGLRHERKRGAA